MKKILVILLLLISLCACDGQNIEKSNLYGIDTYIYEEYNFPQVFNKPVIKNDELEAYLAFDNETINKEVESYIDLLRINAIKDYSDRLTDYDTYYWAKEHYDNVGILYTTFINENHKGEYRNIVYVNIDEQYYLLDIARDTDSKEYLKYYGSDNAVFNTVDELRLSILNNYPVKYYEVLVIDPEDVVIMPNKTLSYKLISRDTECYKYKDFDIPIALGLPKLTEKEIRELARSTDYKKIENSINTAGDAVAFIEALNIRVQTDYESKTFNNGSSVDYGNNWYNNEPNTVYSCSGAEIIKLRVAQCSAMSTLMNFLLYDDYEEFGYITGRGHATNYAKGYDNRYYLIDGSDIIGSHRWLLGHNNDVSADTLNELIDANIQESHTPYNENQNFLISWVYDGVWTFKEPILNNMKNFGLPEGSSNANIWLEQKPSNISYYKPLNPTDHYHFIFETK